MALRTSIPIDQGWHFKQADDRDSPYRPVSQFPTQIHLDLAHHGLISDPFTGKNELDAQWVGEKPWLYRTTFATPAHRHGAAKTELVFDGLDTFASVALNGKTVLEADNMFVSHRVDVAGLLRADGDNELVVTFDVAYFRGWRLVDQHPQHKWGCWNGDVSRLAVRKAQYHWGWDWGPVLLTCGPWRPVHLDVYDSRLADVHVDVHVDDSLKSASVTAHAAIQGPASRVRFDICLGGTKVASADAHAVDGAVAATFKVQNPELWYPIRYGKQPLYTVTATLLDRDRELDSLSKRIGLRRLQLVQRPVQDQPGTSFFFQINNVPVFCGGSNWIPADSFVARISPQRYRDWIRLIADGNQFMVRVWGGGIYEHDTFYDACDELGILVWHDFMFGCGNYPAYPDFLASVEREARDNLVRLRHHASIVVWAGNNEDYQYAESEHLNYDPDDKDPESWLKSDFPARYIYEKLLPDVCKELVPDVPYRPGCPWGGKTTTDPTVGDIHQWNVWHGTQEKWQDFDKLVGRFVSEFGMEAFPSIKTIDAFLPGGKDDADRYAQSSTVDFHNKAAGQERRLALYLAENFRYAPDPIEHFVYCTQLMQAECLGTAYRLWKRQWRGPGREYCSGALVWQINDCWPVTSWSICDYYLRPKLAYYAVKREMRPLSVGIKRRETTRSRAKHSRVDVERRVTVDAWATNLGLDDVVVDCVVKAWDVEDGRETYSATVESRRLLAANRSTELFAMDVPVAARDAGLEARTVVAAYLLRQDGAQLAHHVNWPEPYRHLHLRKPEHLVVELSDDAASVRVAASVPVKGLALECDDDDVVFDDNLIDVVPGETVSVGVQGATAKTAIKTQYLGMMT